jgi:hypothetical protein
MQELPIMTLQLDRAGSGDYAEKANLDVFLVALADVEIKIQSIDPQAELAEPSLRRDDAWRHKRVATTAYYLAANRSFEPGHEAEDWSLAELQTDAIDAGRKL